MAAGSTSDTSSTSIIMRPTIRCPVRYRWPATTWRRFQRRNVTVTDPSAIKGQKRAWNSTRRGYGRAMRGAGVARERCSDGEPHRHALVTGVEVRPHAHGFAGELDVG